MGLKEWNWPICGTIFSLPLSGNDSSLLLDISPSSSGDASEPAQSLVASSILDREPISLSFLRESFVRPNWLCSNEAIINTGTQQAYRRYRQPVWFDHISGFNVLSPWSTFKILNRIDTVSTDFATGSTLLHQDKHQRTSRAGWLALFPWLEAEVERRPVNPLPYTSNWLYPSPSIACSFRPLHSLSGPRECVMHYGRMESSNVRRLGMNGTRRLRTMNQMSAIVFNSECFSRTAGQVWRFLFLVYRSLLYTSRSFQLFT